MIKKYSYRRAGERQKEEIAADTVFIKSTASVVNNVNTNKSYPSLEGHKELYSLQKASDCSPHSAIEV